jgi:hypothetical protein
VLACAGMLRDTDDDEPATRRDVSLTEGHRFAYTVDITYREPSYALHSGIDKAYTGTFQVLASDERNAIALARAHFEATAAISGVGWSRVITGIVCRPR